jgi:hypothetical protein
MDNNGQYLIILKVPKRKYMKKFDALAKTIYLIAALLILEPALKVLFFKAHTGMEWDVVWSNIVDNSHSFSRFFMFWILSPLAGVFLLTFSRAAYASYLLLSSFRIYSLLTYIPFSWPFFTERPHPMAIIFEGVNFILLAYLFYPYIQRFVLSRYLRNIWDARGRVECNFKAYFFVKNKEAPMEVLVKNISSGGMRVKILQGEGADLTDGKVIFCEPSGEPLCFDFKVAAKINASSGDSMDLGIEFINLSPKERMILRLSYAEMYRQQEALNNG